MKTIHSYKLVVNVKANVVHPTCVECSKSISRPKLVKEIQKSLDVGERTAQKLSQHFVYGK